MKKAIVIAIIVILGIFGYFFISSTKHNTSKSMTDQEIVTILDGVLKRVDDFFISADVIPENYKQMKAQTGSDDEFFYRNLWLQDAEHQIKPNQNMFSFSANEIDKYKIPSYVVGCSGRANLFAKYAKEAGIKDVYIVVSVYIPDIGKEHMNGHQIVAVKMSHGLQLLDPANGAYNFNRAKVDGNCKLNEIIDATSDSKKEYKISAIMTQEEHEKLTSVEKLMDVYSRVLNGRTLKDIISAGKM